VEDVLPACLTNVQATASSGVFDTGTGQWGPLSVLSGGTASLTVSATVDPSCGCGVVTNTADITASLPLDSNPANNQASVDFTMQCTDLSLTKTVDNATPQVGDQIMYSVTLTNPNSTPATNITVTDVLPSCLTFDSWQASAGTYNPNNGEWTVPSINPFTYMNVVIFATVTSSCGCGVVTNTADITASLPPDSNPANNQASVDFTMQCDVDLSISKSPDVILPDTFHYGMPQSYLVDVENNGPGAASPPIVVTDQLQSGLCYDASVSPGTDWTCTVTSSSPAPLCDDVVKCTYDPGQGVGVGPIPQLVIGVQVAPIQQWPGGSDLATNCAQVAYPGDTDTSNDESCVAHVITP
jgi:uncharacterized repeat protein (TIGR01451 family)